MSFDRLLRDEKRLRDGGVGSVLRNQFEDFSLSLAWVIGDEPAVILDWAGAGNYAKPS